jgi:DNA-binding transcriptional ArsR family regulator
VARNTEDRNRPESASPVDAVFAALADSTRRQLLERISADGPMSATQLAAGQTIPRQAVVKHLSAPPA